MKKLLIFLLIVMSTNANAFISEIKEYLTTNANCSTFSYKFRGDHLIIDKWDIAKGNYDCLFKVMKPFKSMTIGTGNGGHMFEGHKIADEIKKRGIEVGVYKSCVSACTFIAAASPQLKLCKNTQIGIHHYGVGTKTTKNDEVSQIHYDKMKAYGIKISPYKKIFEATPHNRMYNLNLQEIKSLGFNPVISKKCN